MGLQGQIRAYSCFCDRNIYSTYNQNKRIMQNYKDIQWKVINSNKPLLCVDMDDTANCYKEHFIAKFEKNPNNMYPQAEFDFFRTIPIRKDFQEVYPKLKERFNVMFLTRPSKKNPLCYMEKMLWIRDHFGEEDVDNLTITSEKGLFFGHYLVDDNPWPGFQGEFIHFGTQQWPDWYVVSEYLFNKHPKQ